MVNESVVLGIIAAEARGTRALMRYLEAMPEGQVREVHALYYAARDEMQLEEARQLDQGESRDIVEHTLMSKSVLGQFLAKAVSEGLVTR